MKKIRNYRTDPLPVQYAYDDLQRLHSVVGPEGTNTYSYEGAGTVWRALQLGNGALVSRQYDTLMRLTNMVNDSASGVLSSFAITVDDADQRTQVIREDGTRYDYYYDAIGQLTNAAATLADDTPWRAYRFGYQYDAAGNPVEQDKNGLVFSNSFNHLNQNVATVPGGSLAVMGRVNYAGGTVAVNSVHAQLSPDLIFAATGIPFALGTNALYTGFTDPFGRSTNRETSVVVTQKAYQYDANGNLTNDGRMAYFWNDENRLVAVRDAKTGALIQENRYDGLGRRRERIQPAGSGGVDPGSTNRYLYQDWLVLAVADGAGNLLETYTHGADLSGQIGGGAGGIGGILASTQSGVSAYYYYDFNGNIVQVSGSNQAQMAKYIYNPFGDVLLKEGAFPSRYQFSTKEYDTCTGLNYYGFRFYSSHIGRWLCRDIICETGGVNLYRSMENSPVNIYDGLGLITYNDAVLHWWQGNGISYGISFDEADPNASASDFPEFNQMVQESCDALGDQDVDTTHTFDLGSGHPIGRHNYRLVGTITYIEEGCDWKFSGRISSTSGIDTFDFNPSWFDGVDNNRGFWAEMSTWGGASIGWLIDAEDFDFVIFGDKEITDEGSCD